MVDICDRDNIEGYLLTMDTEKALIHSTISSTLLHWKNGFGKNVVSWVKVSLNNYESCVINGGSTTRYSAYMFILCLEILYILIKNVHTIIGLEIFGYCYLQAAYAGNKNFFLQKHNNIFLGGCFWIFNATLYNEVFRFSEKQFLWFFSHLKQT